jgi:hypothetical protein
MPDLVRDRPAGEPSRICAGTARNGLDPVRIHGGERAGPPREIDDRVSERSRRGGFRRVDDSHDDLVDAQRIGATGSAVAPPHVHARVPQNPARLVARDRHPGERRFNGVVGSNHQPLRGGGCRRRRHEHCGDHPSGGEGDAERTTRLWALY